MLPLTIELHGFAANQRYRSPAAGCSVAPNVRRNGNSPSRCEEQGWVSYVIRASPLFLGTGPAARAYFAWQHATITGSGDRGDGVRGAVSSALGFILFILFNFNNNPVPEDPVEFNITFQTVI